MVADLFYLSAIWLALALILTVICGRLLRYGDLLSSLLYLALLVGLGDFIALWWLAEPLDIIVEGSVLVLAEGVPLLLLLRNWNAPGQAFFLFSLNAVLIYLLYALLITAFGTLSPVSFLFSFLLLLLETAALGLSLTYVFEVLDVICRVRWHARPSPKALGAYAPFVSLHVPAYNEPPELVEKTLRALARLDYPNYEVILVDNNTPYESTWQPLARVCHELGFKCLHLDHWPGYKSGALNFALAMCAPQAEIIGVIDADYIVDSNYLRRIVPYLEDPEVAFVQTPQDYRDYQENRFFQAAYDGYKYFFALSMPSRNERNAIIFCGTMGLLKKAVLQEIGGWDEWCITEDAEASLRILNRGYKAIFVSETYGRGLMPMDFEGLKKQRFRWAFGGVQILKKHWGKLMPWAAWIDPENRLSNAQKYLYLVSGLQWFNELVTFLFTIMVLISAALTIAGHTSLLRPTTEAFVILPIVLIGTNLLRALWGLREALGLSWKRAAYALTLWFGLTWVVALACVQALVRQRGVFLRTPKALSDAAWARALRATSLETGLGVLCLLGGLGAITRAPSMLTGGLLVLCLSQALIYLSAPSQSLLSLEGAGPRPIQGDPAEISGSVAKESRLGLQIAGAALVLLLAAFIASFWPASNKAPGWSGVINPQPLIVPQGKPRLVGPGLPGPLPVSPQHLVPTKTRSVKPSPTAIGTRAPVTPTGRPTPAATPTGAASPTTAPTATAPPSPTPSVAGRPTGIPGATSLPTPSATPTATSPPASSPTAPVCPTPLDTSTPPAGPTPPSVTPTPKPGC
jgi:cellulose synthase/poly-beta-1,6-N-acetylglucosamine synthase-like glycosyltransferase